MVLIDKIKTNSTLLLAVKIILLLASVYYLFTEIQNRDAAQQLHLIWNELSDSHNKYFFVCCVLLSLLNWSLEAFKWKSILRSIYPMKATSALKAILASLSMSIFTPNRLGEYAVRILTVPTGVRKKALASLLVCNISQLSSTLMFGFIAVLVLGGVYVEDLSLLLRVLIATSGIVLTLLAYWNMPIILGWLSEWRLFSYVKKVLEIIQKTERKTMREQLALSALRYIVFVSQQSFFFLLLNIEITFVQAFCTTALFHLAMMGIPTIIWFDVVVKGSVALSLFSLYTDQSGLILAVVFLMWFLNIAFPAILGGLFVFKKDYDAI